MKCKRIAIALIAALVISIAFLSTTSAAVGDCYLGIVRKDHVLNFSIWTTAYHASSFAGTDVNPASIVLHITDAKGHTMTVPVDPSIVSISQSADYVTFSISRAGLPAHAACFATGTIAKGPYTGATFTASGPGWGWGNIH